MITLPPALAELRIIHCLSRIVWQTPLEIQRTREYHNWERGIETRGDYNSVSVTLHHLRRRGIVEARVAHVPSNQLKRGVKAWEYRLKD